MNYFTTARVQNEDTSSFDHTALILGVGGRSPGGYKKFLLKIKPMSPHAFACFSPYLAFLSIFSIPLFLS